MTNEEGYQAVFYFLREWYKITKSDDVGEILSLMECLEDGKPADPAMWDMWKESIEKVKKNGAPPVKTIDSSG